MDTVSLGEIITILYHLVLWFGKMGMRFLRGGVVACLAYYKQLSGYYVANWKSVGVIIGSFVKVFKRWWSKSKWRKE